MRWANSHLVPRRPRPQSPLARRIVEWTDVAYYVFFRVTCVATLITSVIIAAERAL